MLSFIDRRLRVIKQVHNEFMGGLDVIMIDDFYQPPHVPDSWIFKPIINTFNSIVINYWSKYVPCYELKQIIWQDDFDFIDVLNKFRTTSQITTNIKFMNQNYLKIPPIDNTLPYLFYKNVKITMYNKKIFENTLGETYTFLTHDAHA